MNQAIVDILNFATDIFVILGGIVAIIQLWLYRVDKKNEIERHKKESTIMYLNKMLPVLSNLDTEILVIFPQEIINPDDTKLNDEINGKIKEFLKAMERLSVGINTGVYDLEVVGRIIGTGIVKSWDRLEKIIETKRMVLENPNLYIEYEIVVDKLKKFA